MVWRCGTRSQAQRERSRGHKRSESKAKCRAPDNEFALTPCSSLRAPCYLPVRVFISRPVAEFNSYFRPPWVAESEGLTRSLVGGEGIWPDGNVCGRIDGMSDSIDAIYDDGVLKPLVPLSLPDKLRVKLTIDARPNSAAVPSAASPVEPRDEWERQLLGVAKDCGTSLPDSAVSSDELYE